MERTWYIIVDKDGNEIRTTNKREAQTAFRCDGIVTIVRETRMTVDDKNYALMRVYIDMEEHHLKKDLY